MDLSLKNAVAVVAGASRGLGKAVAKELSHEGCKVSICSRTEEKLAKTAQEIESKTGNPVLSYPDDVTSINEIKSYIDATIAEFGDINILICNAGGPPSTHFEDTDEQL